MFSFSFALSMEQPRIAVLDTYKLQGNKGSEVTFPGTVVRELLPGLAEQFRLGMKEAAGTISIHNLDQEGLQVLKRWLNKIYPIQQQFEKKIVEIRTDTDKHLKNIVFPEQEKQSEVAEKNKIVENANKQMEQTIFEMVLQAKSELEKLPGIGEYFLEIFNNFIKWNAHLILAESSGYFAAEQIDFSNDDTFNQLQLLDPEAQLLYLYRAEYTLENIYRAYEWFKTLTDTPTIVAQENNRNLLDAVAQKLIAFTVAHIEDILKKYPTFKNLITEPQFAAIGKMLRAELVEKPMPISFFLKILRTAVPWSAEKLPFVTDLDDQIVALRDNSKEKNIFDFKTNNFKSFPWISSSDKSATFVFWNPDRLISYPTQSNMGITFDVYDLKTGRKIFMPSMTKALEIQPIRSIIPITNNQLLILDDANNLYKLTIKEDKSYTIARFLENVFRIIKMNDQEFISVEKQPDIFHLSLRKIDSGQILKVLKVEGLANYSLNFIRKISNNEVGMVLTPPPADVATLRYLVVSIPDLKVSSLNDFTYRYQPDHYNYYKFIPMNSQLILIKEISKWNNKEKIILFNVVSKGIIELSGSAIVLDANHLAAWNQKNFVIEFIIQNATLLEILDEIQKNIVTQPPQIQKRPAPVQSPAITPAAKGSKSEAPESKRQKSESEQQIPAAAIRVRSRETETKQPQLEKSE